MVQQKIEKIKEDKQKVEDILLFPKQLNGFATRGSTFHISCFPFKKISPEFLFRIISLFCWGNEKVPKSKMHSFLHSASPSLGLLGIHGFPIAKTMES